MSGAGAPGGGAPPPPSAPAALLGMTEEALSAAMRAYEALGRKADVDEALGGAVSAMLAREVLAAPLAALCAAFPGWLASARPSLPPAAYAARGRQYQAYQALVLAYETEPAALAKLASLMQAAAGFGPPPAELVEALGGGLRLSADGSPQLPGLPAAGGDEAACGVA